jgi:hypothetical protein
MQRGCRLAEMWAAAPQDGVRGALIRPLLVMHPPHLERLFREDMASVLLAFDR